MTIKREMFTAIQRGGRIDDRTGRIVKNDVSRKEDGGSNVVSGVVSLSQAYLTERQKKYVILLRTILLFQARKCR